MAPTPSPRQPPAAAIIGTPTKTPTSIKHRLQFNTPRSTTAAAVTAPMVPTEHPVEVIGRIRDSCGGSHPPTIDLGPDGRSIRVRTDIGYRDFTLDGVSISENEDLKVFYEKFVRSRVEGVKAGAKCTVMMYGPTGSGKSHTMFGCSKQPGILYRALKDILRDNGEGEGSGGGDAGFRLGVFIQVAVLEIYNEEIYDLLSGNGSAGGLITGAQLPKGSTSKVKLEVMGKKAKNATHLCGNEAGKLSRELMKVEKRRIVKSTLCNERSSRSHCLIILDVPSVGGSLMLVDMAGSENIDQAGQIGLEAKMQTAKINQGNTALKRVVECIANGDSHVPFRDSKLTMLLQDSFEDDKSKILMILCASPDFKELHKTISTLEYGAKAKCIVRAAHMPTPKDKMNSEESSVFLRSRIEAMNQFIYKLQIENKLKEKEIDEANKELTRKEEETARLRARLQVFEGKTASVNEKVINSKVDARTQSLKIELMKMEEKVIKQQEELDLLRRRLEETEFEKSEARDNATPGFAGERFMKRLTELYADGDQGMVKSMELDMGDQPTILDIREVKENHQRPSNHDVEPSTLHPSMETEDQIDANQLPTFPDRACLSTVFETDFEGEDGESTQDEEVEKEVVEDSTVYGGLNNKESGAQIISSFVRSHANDSGSDIDDEPDSYIAKKKKGAGGFTEIAIDVASDRRTRIQNIFRLCGNYRELAEQVKVRSPFKKCSEDGIANVSPLPLVEEFNVNETGTTKYHDMKRSDSPISALVMPFASLPFKEEQKSEQAQEKENCRPGGEDDGFMEVFAKWEASKESMGSLIKIVKVMKNSNLSDLRKLVETHLEEENNKQPFSFLLLGGDPLGAPVKKEEEAVVPVSKLPICNSHQNSRLACLRPAKNRSQKPDIPFSSLENTLPAAAASKLPDSFSPTVSFLAGLRV